VDTWFRNFGLFPLGKCSGRNFGLFVLGNWSVEHGVMTKWLWQQIRNLFLFKRHRFKTFWLCLKQSRNLFIMGSKPDDDKLSFLLIYIRKVLCCSISLGKVKGTKWGKIPQSPKKCKLTKTRYSGHHSARLLRTRDNTDKQHSFPTIWEWAQQNKGSKKKDSKA
jgi:hypothetical protein